MGFWNSIKNAVGIQSAPQQQPQMMVNIPLAALSPEQQQMFGGMAQPAQPAQPTQPVQFAQPMMRQKKPPMMITRIWKALNAPMVGRHAPHNQGNVRMQKAPKPLTYPLPPVNRDKERRGVW